MTNITLETFKTITASDGSYSTWTDIINAARTALPINNEILGAPFKSMEEVVGDNITFENTSTKFVEYFRDDLDNNNLLELDKMVMFLNQDFRTSIEYSIMDQKSAKDWASILSDAINQMFITKNDISNALTVDEIQKVALALGNFTIVKNADEMILDANGNLDEKAFKTLGIQLRRMLNKYRTKRTKYSKGIDPERLKWVNSYDFSLNLLGSLTAGSNSPQAYEDTKSKNTIQNFLGTTFTQSLYLGSDFDMQEFVPKTGTNNGQKQNEGSHTGNLVKPFQAKHIFSLAWLPESLLYYGHNFNVSERPKTNSLTKNVLGFLWRGQVAILPILADFNHIFVTKLPTFKSYTKVDGTVVEALDLSNFENYKKFKQQLRAEQPMLYNTIIDANGITSNGVKDDATWKAKIQENTLKWVGDKTTKEKK